MEIEHMMDEANGLDRVLSLTRAWTLVRFFESKMLTTVSCTSCQGKYVAHALDLAVDYVCGLCRVPSRAGKRREPRPAQLVTH